MGWRSIGRVKTGRFSAQPARKLFGAAHQHAEKPNNEKRAQFRHLPAPNPHGSYSINPFHRKQRSGLPKGGGGEYGIPLGAIQDSSFNTCSDRMG